MSKVVVKAFSLSLDGYGAGPNQGMQNPLGENGEKLHEWFYPTRTFQKMYGNDKGATGPDEDFAARSMQNLGAWIMGRNMFSPMRGAWQDESWQGWWGDNPPYHTDVFVLTHHARKPVQLAGDTTFHFVTDGVRAALDRAKASAKGKDVRIGGGANTIRQFLEAGLIDEMHLAVAPVLLGTGENLFAGMNLAALGFAQVEYFGTPKAAHYVLRRK